MEIKVFTKVKGRTDRRRDTNSIRNFFQLHWKVLRRRKDGLDLFKIGIKVRKL